MKLSWSRRWKSFGIIYTPCIINDMLKSSSSLNLQTQKSSTRSVPKKDDYFHQMVSIVSAYGELESLVQFIFELIKFHMIHLRYGVWKEATFRCLLNSQVIWWIYCLSRIWLIKLRGNVKFSIYFLKTGFFSSGDIYGRFRPWRTGTKYYVRG